MSRGREALAEQASSSPPGPLRTCIGCRSNRPAAELLRIVRRSDQELAVEPFGHGRGAWLCADKPASCAEAALRHRRFAPAFRRPVERSAAERLLAQLRSSEEGAGDPGA